MIIVRKGGGVCSYPAEDGVSAPDYLMKELMVIDHYDRDGYGRWVYEMFKIRQPHIRTEGLYTAGMMNYIACPDLEEDALALDGSRITEWLKNNKIAGWHTELVKPPPAGAAKMEERNIEETIVGKGDPRTTRDVVSFIALSLPRTFPKVNIREIDENRFIPVTVERELTAEECSQLKEVLLALEMPVGYRILVDESLAGSKVSFRNRYIQGDIDIIPTRFLPFKPSTSLMALLEDDEDFWLSKRVAILAGTTNNLDEIIPKAWDRDESRCLVNATVFTQNDIRNYLSIYQSIIMALPIADQEQLVLESLGVTVNELAELSRMGRVRFILPQSIDRYPMDIIEPLVDAVPENFLLSRRLAAATVIDNRRRFPLLYPPLEAKERSEFLSRIILLMNTMEPNIRKLFEPFVLELTRIWSISEVMLNQRGAMATAFLGLSALTSSMAKSLFGRDNLIEIYSASASVEWAAPLFACVSPNFTESYSEEVFTEIIAKSYSFTSNIQLFKQQTSVMLENIMSIGATVPVIDFASSFKSADIERFRALIFELERGQVEHGDFHDVIGKFNAEVRKYERNARRLTAWDIGGLVPVLAGVAAAELAARGYPVSPAAIPFALWLLKRLGALGQGSEILGAALDKVSAMATGTTPAAGLVSRLKRNLKSIH